MKPSKDALRAQLATLIKKVLRAQPKLCYFQGYHDIAACFLLVMGPNRAVRALYNISLFYIRDAMQSKLEPVMQQLDLIFTLIRLTDEQLYRFLEECEVPPFYALSWVLTWGTHDVKELELSARIVEFILASHPCMILYVAAALTLHFRDEILSLEPDYAMVHTSLSKLFTKVTLSQTHPLEVTDSLDVESLLEKTAVLFQSYPLPKLRQASKMPWLHPNSCINLYDIWFLNVKTEDLPISNAHIQGLMEQGDLNQLIQKPTIWKQLLNPKLPIFMDTWTLCIGVVVILGLSWKYHTANLFS
ncbi:GTPase-activating protein gyp8 [Entomophthora muscae]|uniref:GTPase-activating protein gyp8 n=1 Tax=Entomophthora muscae TaxID=34485 RepID=A0ACC2RYN5_9FUNG|nr:GTPase-activating protein gyp8 [Entomophthora muscae]